MNVVDIKHISKSFDQQKVLTDVSLQVPEKAIYGLLGPNGAGKSTTMKILIGLYKQDQGQVTLFQKAQLKQALPDIGVLIEQPSYYGNLTAYENLKILQELAKVPVKNIDEVLKIVDLAHTGKKKVKNFSLGMKQRLGIASALLKFPKLLILDEPTNGLDPEGITEIRELIKSLPEKYGMTVLISSHLLSEIEQTCDYVGIINHGKTIYEASMAEIKQQTQTIFKVRNSHGLETICQNYPADQLVINNDKIILNTTNPEQISHLNHFLVTNDYDVYEIQPEDNNLEKIFMEKIKGEN